MALTMRVFLLLALVGCVDEGPTNAHQWHDIPLVTLTPTVFGVDAAAWEYAVADAAEDWEQILRNVDCEVTFAVATGGHEVCGWAVKEWPFPTHWMGVTGYGAHESIDVIAELDTPRLHQTLMHELGHAMGLEHVEGRTSVMNPAGGVFVEQDVADAARAIGCN